MRYIKNCMGVLLLLMLSHLPLLTHQLNNRWLLKGYSNIGFIMISAGILILLIIINILRLIQSLGRKHRRLRGLQYGKAVIKRSFWLLLLQILLYLLILPDITMIAGIMLICCGCCCFNMYMLLAERL